MLLQILPSCSLGQVDDSCLEEDQDTLLLSCVLGWMCHIFAVEYMYQTWWLGKILYLNGSCLEERVQDVLVCRVHALMQVPNALLQ